MFVFDIETVALDVCPTALNEMNERNLRKKEEDGTWERAALNPFSSEVACIGYYNTTRNKGAVLAVCPGMSLPNDIVINDKRFFVRCYDDEKSMLTAFSSVVAKQTEGFATYNGRGFDIPYLLIRAAKHGVMLPHKLHTANRYAPRAHFDMKDCLEHYSAIRMDWSLEVLCEHLGVPSSKDAISGRDVGKYWRNGECEAVITYCAKDVIATAACAEKLAPYFMANYHESEKEE